MLRYAIVAVVFFALGHYWKQFKQWAQAKISGAK